MTSSSKSRLLGGRRRARASRRAPRAGGSKVTDTSCWNFAPSVTCRSTKRIGSYWFISESIALHLRRVGLHVVAVEVQVLRGDAPAHLPRGPFWLGRLLGPKRSWPSTLKTGTKTSVTFASAPGRRLALEQVAQQPEAGVLAVDFAGVNAALEHHHRPLRALRAAPGVEGAVGATPPAPASGGPAASRRSARSAPCPGRPAGRRRTATPPRRSGRSRSSPTARRRCRAVVRRRAARGAAWSWPANLRAPAVAVTRGVAPARSVHGPRRACARSARTGGRPPAPP